MFAELATKFIVFVAATSVTKKKPKNNPINQLFFYKLIRAVLRVNI